MYIITCFTLIYSCLPNYVLKFIWNCHCTHYAICTPTLCASIDVQLLMNKKCIKQKSLNKTKYSQLIFTRNGEVLTAYSGGWRDLCENKCTKILNAFYKSKNSVTEKMLGDFVSGDQCWDKKMATNVLFGLYLHN